ncbi:hypothetical protein D3OALGB2SA_3835 [Olavius algarvensis associated proteobacterium Delta 3]|nr:hypothetical protein D3OALGB2SA_3835 [Olavius algarvensis associated proteobacterium Delta 3]
MNLKQLSESCSDLWIVDAVERCRVIGIRLTKTHYVQTEYTATTIYPETRFNP